MIFIVGIALKRGLIVILVAGVLFSLLFATTQIIPNEKLLLSKWTNYHSYEEMQEVLNVLNEYFPDLVDVFSIGVSRENRTIYCIRITNEGSINNKTQLLIVGYHHAREPITVEAALYFATSLVVDWTENSTLQEILDHVELFIIPALNVDGFKSFKNNPYQRKNSFPTDDDGDGLKDEDPLNDENGDGLIGSLYFTNGTFIRYEGKNDDEDERYNEDWVGGVDLNRNYPFMWGMAGASSDPSSEVYMGPSSASEPEVQAVISLVNQHHFEYAVSLHSGVRLLLYPWAYTNSGAPKEEELKALATRMGEASETAVMQSSSLYLSSGDFADWIYGVHNTLAFTFEIYSNGDALRTLPGPTNDTYWQVGFEQLFNPAPNEIAPVLEYSIKAFWVVLNAAFEKNPA